MKKNTSRKRTNY